MRRIIINIHGDINPEQALDCCLKVARQGEISQVRGVKQHCFATTFESGISIFVFKNKKSERFVVAKEG